MTNFDNVLGSISRGGPGAIRYDGDSLTNAEEHQYRIDVAGMLEHDTEQIRFPSDVGSGAAIAAAEEKINEVRSMMLKIADGFRTIGEAAKAAAPAIRNGTAADPEVQDALRRSSAAYESIKDIVPPEEADPMKAGERRLSPDNRADRSPEPEAKPKEEVSPRTNVSADQPAQPAAAPAQSGPMAPGPMQGAPAAQGPMAGPAGGPTTAPSAFVPGTGPDGRPYGAMPRPNRRGGDTGPNTYGSSLGDGGGVVAPMPLVNPSVTGGRVDPAQISGRTASTAPSAGLPPLKTGPAGTTGMMGGMGGMPMGGPMGGGAGGAARPDMPQPRRDRASERILTGEEARDKALVSHILRDDDPPASEYIDSTELAELLPDERHPSAPQRAEAEPPAPIVAPPAAPVVMNVPPPAPVVMDVPPAPAPPRLPGRDQPVQYPGEPRDDEKW